MQARASMVVSVAAVAAVALGALSGCGGTLYAVQAIHASNKLEEAKNLDAEKLAPYEYYFAREHLTKAMSEASEGDYSDAINLAEVADQYADKAIKHARDVRRGEGR